MNAKITNLILSTFALNVILIIIIFFNDNIKYIERTLTFSLVTTIIILTWPAIIHRKRRFANITNDYAPAALFIATIVFFILPSLSHAINSGIDIRISLLNQQLESGFYFINQSLAFMLFLCSMAIMTKAKWTRLLVIAYFAFALVFASRTHMILSITAALFVMNRINIKTLAILAVAYALIQINANLSTELNANNLAIDVFDRYASLVDGEDTRSYIFKQALHCANSYNLIGSEGLNCLKNKGVIDPDNTLIYIIAQAGYVPLLLFIAYVLYAHIILYKILGHTKSLYITISYSAMISTNVFIDSPLIYYPLIIYSLIIIHPGITNMNKQQRKIGVMRTTEKQRFSIKSPPHKQYIQS